MDQKYSKFVKTAQTWVEGYELGDIEAIMAPRTTDCVYHSLPSSPDIPTQNNDEYRARFAGMLPYLKDFRVTDFDTVVDTKTNKVVLNARSTAGNNHWALRE